MLIYEDQMSFSHNIIANENIVPECKGCKRILKRYDGQIICCCNCFPHTKWWFGMICPDTTNVEHEECEHPIKES